jgi:futalosine hydrolase
MSKKFLIVAATKYEVEPLLNHFNVKVYGETGIFMNEGEIQLEALITGVGMVNTAYYLGSSTHNLLDYVINVGICGAVNKNLNIGEVVNVTEDILSEMGAENDTEFIKYEDLKLGGSNKFQNLVQIDNATLNQLKKVKGITVNTVHGNEESIKKVISLYNPDVESMEGAAFFNGCRRISENYFQIRAVSNYVEKRDRSKWNVPLAIDNLNETVIKIINEIQNS